MTYTNLIQSEQRFQTITRYSDSNNSEIKTHLKAT
jgi:hypothetical protein